MAKAAKVAPATDVAEAELLSAPCQVRDYGSKTICGAQKKSLAPHLKAHKLSGGKTWNTAMYKKKFPKFSLGVPSYSPPPEAVAKLQAAAPHNQDKPPKPTEEEKAAKVTEYEERINARMEEFWSMCERDPAARMVALAAAKDEAMLQDAYDEIEKIRVTKKFDDLKFLNASIESINTRLQINLKSLNLTVTQRRASNQLGSDSVAQLICNYANTLRKMSPERQEAFHRREATVMLNMVERVRVNLLNEVDDNFDQATAVVDQDDFRQAILSFNPANK